IATLNGHGPKDFTEHSLVVAAHMVSLARSESFSNELVKEMSERLSDGSAWQVFRSMVAAQGGSLDHIDNPDLLPGSNNSGAVSATEDGYLKRMDALTVGVCSMELGAGRKSKTDPIDYGVGIEVLAKVGDKIQEGQELLHIHANSKDSLDQAMNELESAIQISDQPVPELDLFYQVVE
ncbi:MAG: pyrimidine-nucleoside phosphorylase, partial [Chloroflexota bacterium]